MTNAEKAAEIILRTFKGRIRDYSYLRGVAIDDAIRIMEQSITDHLPSILTQAIEGEK